MPSYLLIESRDPFESRGFGQRCELAAALAADGAAVTLFLVENGVLAARGAAGVHDLDELSRSGVAVLADEFALRGHDEPAWANRFPDAMKYRHERIPVIAWSSV